MTQVGSEIRAEELEMIERLSGAMGAVGTGAGMSTAAETRSGVRRLKAQKGTTVLSSAAILMIVA